MADDKQAEGANLSEEQIEGNRDGLKKGLLKLKSALATESTETKEMLEIYFRFTKGQATKEELKKAEEQLQDVIRAMGLTVFGILPLAPLTIPVIVKLGQKLGIDVLPSALRESDDEET